MVQNFSKEVDLKKSGNFCKSDQKASKAKYLQERVNDYSNWEGESKALIKSKGCCILIAKLPQTEMT